MELTDNELTLREFRDTDAGQLAALCNNKKIWDNVRDYLPFPYSESNANEFIRCCQGENPRTTFAIAYNGQFAGTIGLVPQLDVYRLTAEIGYWLGEPFWGKGITTRAVKLMVDYGFNTLKLVRIFTGVFGFNKASQRVLEKAGFTLECIAEKAVFKNNTIVSEYRYAILNDRTGMQDIR